MIQTKLKIALGSSEALLRHRQRFTGWMGHGAEVVARILRGGRQPPPDSLYAARAQLIWS